MNQKVVQNVLPGISVSKRKPIRVIEADLVRVRPLLQESHIPMVVEPVTTEVDLEDWMRSHLPEVDRLLLTHRALLFRNFNVLTSTDFAQIVKASSSGSLLEYRDRSSPRHEMGDKIYTSTDYPSNESIFLHNEGTYWLSWPRKIYFCCIKAANSGGGTPIADCRRIYDRVSPAIREQFTAKKVSYLRNYNDGLGLSWQSVFQTDERDAVEEYCSRNRIQYEWKSGGRLRTRQVRQAVVQHPQTGERLWFNHAAFFHVSTLDLAVREVLLRQFHEEDLPHNTYYGDGTTIPLPVVDELRSAYLAEKVVFQWQEGDVLLLDNMSVAHGRQPYTGNRLVLTAMADPFDSRT